MLFTTEFLARAMGNRVQYFDTFSNKSPTPDVDVRVRRGVVQVPVEQTGIRAVVPITTKLGRCAP